MAAADGSAKAVVTAGFAGVVAGSLSMAVGEYVSVSSQLDVERADLAREREELRTMPERELAELTRLYVAKGLPRPLACQVAEALTRKDSLAAHAREELGIDIHALARPLQAAGSSAVSFAAGAILPLAAIGLTTGSLRTPITWVVAILALGLLGGWSARLGGAAVAPAVTRVVVGGAVAMGLTMAIGALFGALPA